MCWTYLRYCKVVWIRLHPAFLVVENCTFREFGNKMVTIWYYKIKNRQLFTANYQVALFCFSSYLSDLSHFSGMISMWFIDTENVSRFKTWTSLLLFMFRLVKFWNRNKSTTFDHSVSNWKVLKKCATWAIKCDLAIKCLQSAALLSLLKGTQMGTYSYVSPRNSQHAYFSL